MSNLNRKEEIDKLEELCKPIAEYLKSNYDPYATVVITDSHIKLVRGEIGIPVKETALEGSVQEQVSEVVIPVKINLEMFASQIIEATNHKRAVTGKPELIL